MSLSLKLDVIMENVAIFGASHGLGLAMAKYYSQQGFSVIGLGRGDKPSPEFSLLNGLWIQCDALDLMQVQTAVQMLPNSCWVISTMGSFNAEQYVDYQGNRHIIDCLEDRGGLRFLLITSLGCGDSWQYLPPRAKAVFGRAVREKSLAEMWLQTSALDYTIVRPGGLIDGELTHTGELSQGQEVHGCVSRTEVARLSHQLLMDSSSIGQIYHCVDPNAKYQ